MQAASGYPEPVLKLKELLETYLDPAKVEIVLKAYEVAEEAHRGQTRKSHQAGQDEVPHPHRGRCGEFP